jgi:alkanesulfonate monooxygenase SsuD/methylene tetrahydromethanopterin reductase-like flavin-dependent oxidoreductase (luciferase family)
VIRLGINVPNFGPQTDAQAMLSWTRFALGVGVGWSATEFAAVGADYARRGQITDQYLQVITTAWRQRRIDAKLPGLRITDVATGPNPAGGGIPLWVGGSASPAIRRAVRFGTAWHPINPGRNWLQQTGLPALRRESERAGAPMPAIVPRIKFRTAAAPVAGPDRPLGAGTITQITGDLRFLAGLGADLVILDPNPDTPRPRDYACERNDLLTLRAALTSHA